MFPNQGRRRPDYWKDESLFWRLRYGEVCCLLTVQVSASAGVSEHVLIEEKYTARSRSPQADSSDRVTTDLIERVVLRPKVQLQAANLGARR
jgi:hypothetical protein